MTYEVQQTRWDRIIRRVSGSIGPGSRVSETISELFPMIDVERVPGELLILGGTAIASGGGTQAGVVAESSVAQLFNPADSGTLVTLTNVYFAMTGVGTVRWGTTSTQRGTVISTQTFRDTRSVAPALPVAQVSQETAVALADGTNQSRLLANVNFRLEDSNGVAVLAPGTGFEIGIILTNIPIFYTFYWRERPAEQSELSL